MDNVVYALVKRFPNSILAKAVTDALVEKAGSSLAQEEKSSRAGSTGLPITTSYFEEAGTAASIDGTDASSSISLLDFAAFHLIPSRAFDTATLEEKNIIVAAILELFVHANGSSMGEIRTALAKHFDKLADVSALSTLCCLVLLSIPGHLHLLRTLVMANIIPLNSRRLS